MPAEWHRTNHSFEERNNLYIELATHYSVSVIQACLANTAFYPHLFLLRTSMPSFLLAVQEFQHLALTHVL